MLPDASSSAAGLTVAIPVTIMLHYFDRKIEKVTFLLSKFGQLLVHHFDEEHQHKDGTEFNGGREKTRFANVPG